MKSTVLITGANKGLGLETGRCLAEKGWNVILGVRNEKRGQDALQQLAELGLKVSILQIDVTSDASVKEAVSKFSEGHNHLDVLINNAGIGGSREHPEETLASSFKDIYDTNVLGVVRVTQAFLPLMRKAVNPRIVMVSSTLGSFHTMTGSGGATFESGLLQLVYPSSKAALNMIVTQYSKAFPEIKINAVNPGFTKTDINHNTGRQTVTEGAEVIVNLASIDSDGPTGGFFDRNGSIQW